MLGLPLFPFRKDKQDLTGRVALITGSAGALGSEAARRLAARGVRLALADLNSDAVDTLAADLTRSGAEAVAFSGDVLDDAQLHELTAAVIDTFGRVDVFVSSAGVEINAAFHTVSTREIDTQLGLHLRSPMLMVRDLLPGMLERNSGHIIVVSSMSGKIPLPVKAPYAAAKAGSIAFCHSLRRELDDTDVAVSVIAPGVVTGGGQAHRALEGSAVRVPRSLGTVSIGEVATVIDDVLDSRAPEVAVQATPPFLLNALQSAAPDVTDHILKASGIGDFWRAVAREQGRT
ncbi:NADP-dependent 3-hydroxy acid dehydrogenase YdfG [Williamsia sterculiae]|uniref:NADP-dependent 3-hydroxy acid dehydrogenase YdfG n=2 Tax=Williamsia sterculiae TaxID=1344003 RepID=A0A1N7HF32_9NOCA|nr:NADP-dependent 3-hydroxy acid dehydrogenase YdfG [Williamsia sterculiae]